MSQESLERLCGREWCVIVAKFELVDVIVNKPCLSPQGLACRRDSESVLARATVWMSYSHSVAERIENNILAVRYHLERTR